MPDVTQTEVGRRLYHVHREKTVEGSMKLMQQGVGPEWKKFSEADIGLLLHLLQCTWNTVDQKVWDRIPFSKITAGEVRQILSHGEGVGPGCNPAREAVAGIKKILLSIR
jgi:hypothetical protein